MNTLCKSLKHKNYKNKSSGKSRGEQEESDDGHELGV